MTSLIEHLMPGELWVLVGPCCRAPPRPPYGGRNRAIPDRTCLAAIVVMARTSTPWRLLPARELGCGSSARCWRRLAEWAGAGVFDQLHLEVLDRLGEHGQLDGSRASVDTRSVRAKGGGPRGRNAGRSWQAWTQAALVGDGGGLPLTAAVTAANVNDTSRFEAVRDDVPAVGTPAGRHRWRVERSLSWPGLLAAPFSAVGPGLGTRLRVGAAGCAVVGCNRR